jgi:hypothetical protein
MSAFRKLFLWLVTGALLAGLTVACGGDGDGGAPQSPQAVGPRLADQWAGRVDGTDAYISVFTLDNGDTGAYLANGRDIAALVLGTIEAGSLRLRPVAEGEINVQGTVADAQVTGTVTISGEENPFTADRASGEAGWYRGRTLAGGKLVTAGYILLDDGTQKGAVRQGDKVLGAPTFDPSKPTIQAGGISVDILPVAEFVEREGGLA